MTEYLFALILMFCGYLGPGGYHARPNLDCLMDTWECTLPAYGEGEMEAERKVWSCLEKHHEHETKKFARGVL